MKHFKKFFSYLVALTMVLSLAAFTGTKVYADGETNTGTNTGNSLTITNTGKTAHIFELYQIFTGTKKADSDTTLGDIKWGSSVTLAGQEALGAAKDYAKKLEKDEKTQTAEISAEDFAKILVKGDGTTSYLSTKPIDTQKVDPNGNATFKVAKSGYYLVKDKKESQTDAVKGAYTDYIVQVVGNVKVEAKLSVPTTIKKVQENTKTVTGDEDTNIPGLKVGDHYNDVADYDIGDNVPFELIGTLPADYDKYATDKDATYYYQFTDTMDDSFTLDKTSVKAYFTNENDNDGNPIWNEIDSSKYSTSDSVTNGSKKSFTVTFDDLKKATSSLTPTSKIKVEFDATLNKKAKIGLPGNENKSYLTFSNDVNSNSHGKTAEDKVIVFTYEIDTTKIDAATKDSSNPTALKDAQFQIKKGDKYLHQNEKGYITWGPEEGAKTFTSDANGKFVIRGLDSGTYTFHETKAPAGYNLPDNDFRATLTATTYNKQDWNENASSALTELKLGETEQDATVQDTEHHGVANQKITNTKGSNLPSTGGMGTTLLYVAGGILVACAAAYVVMSRKHSTNK